MRHTTNNLHFQIGKTTKLTIQSDPNIVEIVFRIEQVNFREN